MLLAVADTGFEKGGGALTHNFQINGILFCLSFTLEEVKFVEKREAPPSKSATDWRYCITQPRLRAGSKAARECIPLKKPVMSISAIA